MEEKRKDLDAERQKRLLRAMVDEVSRGYPDLYYQPTSQIALIIHGHIRDGAKLRADDKELLLRLSERDIEVLLSLH
ncbi:MAG: hypothetical protein AAF841_09585 [Pseudomonadota bacterium]